MKEEEGEGDEGVKEWWGEGVKVWGKEFTLEIVSAERKKLSSHYHRIS